MTSTAMLDRALADARASRLALYAALDELHAAHKREQRLREELADVKACWQRCAERLMDDDDLR